MVNSAAMRRRAVARRGFTLLEILVAIFILAVVTSLVMAAFGGIYEGAERIT